jgi:hypothetical protein
VIVDLPGHERPNGERSIDRELKLLDGRWQAVPLAPVR